MTRKNQSGFTLVQTAFVLLIVGLFVGAVFAFYTPALQANQYQTTIERQKKIARILADYSLRTGRLPCPALPDPPTGTPLGTQGTTCTGFDADDFEGIVPFRELGITQEDITDGYGRPFTYMASPAAVNPSPDYVEASCRLPGIWHDGVRNRNPNKAMICCATYMSYDHIRVFYMLPAPKRPVTPIQSMDPSLGGVGWPGDMAHFDTAAAPAATPGNFPYFPYVLVSHGENGRGSYRFGYPGPDFANLPDTVLELSNVPQQGDFEFHAGRIDKASSDYFDDVVFWRTQYSMMADVGQTCAVP